MALSNLHLFVWMTLFGLALAKNSSNPHCEGVANIKCKNGVILPAWLVPGNDSGTGFIAVKAFIYFVVMVILFLGIAIISDRFMASIEVITSKEKEISFVDHTGAEKVVIVKIWNDTVANLTLMALGSSAPEILLSVIEIIGRNFEAGELGPSTIVGSAAFNLFMITAVCVWVLPEGEVRKIEHLNVFAFTATCSIFAYVWMYIILAVTSPGVIDIWEGVVTLLCFPGMVGIAWLIDTDISCFRSVRRRMKRQRKQSQTHRIVSEDDDDSTELRMRNENGDLEKFDEAELELLSYKDGDDPEKYMREKKRLAMEAFRKVREKHPDATIDSMHKLVDAENRRMQHKSRAYYRIQAVRHMTGQGNVVKKVDKAEIETVDPKQAVVVPKQEGIYFEPSEYDVVENCGVCTIQVVRHGSTLYETVEVDYETLDGTANAGSDYVAVKGSLQFSPGETSKKILIKIIDDDIFELDEHFYCKLSNPRCTSNAKTPVELGKEETATITILDDDYAGVFTIENDCYEIMETAELMSIRIVRLVGIRGTVRIPYHCEEVTAKGGGEDYEDVIGEAEFLSGELVKHIDIPIINRGEYEKDKVFKFVLGMPITTEDHEEIEDEDQRKIMEAGKPSLGENASAEVHIVENKEFRDTIDNMLQKANQSSFIASNSWIEQFKEAFQVEAGEEDEDSDEPFKPSYYDYFMHYLSLIWKVLFALVPPTDIAGGWACFWVSIGMIGVLTAFAGDIASHFGCTVGLADSVVAISFVALGTSLPDTFASKTATIEDDTADNGVGNVTGSNSVNVFLGIGLAWTIAAIYHVVKGGRFEVPAGSLGFSVLIFCIFALITIGILMYRRFNPDIGAELGGPMASRYPTVLIMVGLWIVYVLLSALVSYCHIRPSF